MVSPVHMHLQTRKRGLYESFDFRGVSADQRYAFLLRHTVIRPWLGRSRLEVAMICFDRKTRQTFCLAEQEELSATQEQQLAKARDWENCTFSLSSGSFFEIGRDSLRGKLHTTQGSVHWHLRLFRRDACVHALPPGLCRRWSWPRHKVQVRDAFVKYLGKIQMAGLDLAGDFSGSNQHYWGDGYPMEFAAGQCNAFDEDSTAVFHGFSSRLQLANIVKTPYLGMATLTVDGRWYNFNQLSRCFRHHVEALDNFRWRVSYINGEHGLDVEVSGDNPRMTPWAGWHAEQPGGGRAVVKATPFAHARLTLYQRASHQIIAELHSTSMELKTHLPENLPGGYGFWIDP